MYPPIKENSQGGESIDGFASPTVVDKIIFGRTIKSLMGEHSLVLEPARHNAEHEV